jgi:hypothetical protein
MKNKIDPKLQDTLYHLQNKVIEIMMEKEEKVIKEVLENLLKRKPTIEDAKGCTRMFNGDNINEFYLHYEGVCLGSIKRNFNTSINKQPTFNITFTPSEMFK